MRYTLTFLDYWHISSGMSGGAELDSSVVKDADGFAYVPGKTLKGLLREMALLLDEEFALLNFGSASDHEGLAVFSNATLKASTKKLITPSTQTHLYEMISSTALDENGIAKDGSLRSIEVVVPLSLHGTIENCSDEKTMAKAMGMIKRMGLNRNRGLGRCRFKVEGATL